MGFMERAACPMCESSDIGDLCQLPFRKGPVRGFLEQKYPHAVDRFGVLNDMDYILTECSDCQAIFQRTIPDEALTQGLYEKWAEDPTDGFATSRRNRGVAFFTKHADQIIDILRFLDRNPYELRAFDYAFGWGHWCRLVQGFGCTVYGTELSDKRRAIASTIGITVVPAEDIPNHRFDWINANQVLEHIPEPLSMLRCLKSALADGGIMTMAVPGADKLKQKIAQRDWSAVFGPLMPLEHINYFPRGCLASMAARAGLVPVTVPERFVWRDGPSAAFRQNAKALLRIIGAPVSNHLFGCFTHAPDTYEEPR